MFKVIKRDGSVYYISNHGKPNPASPPPFTNWLRRPSIAMTCIHLDPHKLSNTEAKGMEETAKKLETSCRGCDGNTALQKCHGGGGHDGYTTVSFCVNKCTIFQGPTDGANTV